jgi:hypothetical protein
MVLALSTRQVHRLLKAYRSDGAGSLAHGRACPPTQGSRMIELAAA